jgi:hypothetical protein
MAFRALAFVAASLVLGGCRPASIPMTAAAGHGSATASATASAASDGALAEPPAAPGASSVARLREGVDVRAPAVTLHFDPKALPTAAWGDPSPGAGFTLRPTTDGWHLWMRTALFAEVVVAAEASVPNGASVPVQFVAFTGGPFGRGSAPPCGGLVKGTRIATWGGIAAHGWNDAGVDVEMDEGDLDLATCSATARRTLAGRAAAIVPGFVYALRVQDDGEELGTESIVAFLPRAALAGVAADPTAPVLASNTGSFTRLTFRLGREGAGASSLRLTPASMDLWARMRANHAPKGAVWEDGTQAHLGLLVGLDVVRQADVELGTLSVALPPGVDGRPFAKLTNAVQSARR